MARSEMTESTYARLINIAGRQRMLSQRIGFLSAVLNTAPPLQDANGSLPPDSHLTMLKSAADDFETGYKILQQGDLDQDLPFWDAQSVETILNGTDSVHGASVIEKFMAETHQTIGTLEAGQARSDTELEAFSSFVLTDVLGILQKIVTALETDF